LTVGEARLRFATMTDPARFFSDRYDTARKRFLIAADAARADLRPYPHPLPGPAGEPLGLDVAWLGPPDADRVLLTISGTHGAEGFIGSALQTGWFETGAAAAALSEGMALMAVHALNPYGFAWLRRVNEDNIDLNRNFLADFSELPDNPGYRAHRDLFVPAEWSAEIAEKNLAACQALKAELGETPYRLAHSSGQYVDPDGIFFGGSEPSWSHLTLRSAVAERLGAARGVAVVDFHTGLGPRGHGERISTHGPGSRGEALLRAAYGDDFTSTKAGTSVSTELNGTVLDALERWLPNATVGAVALEFGTIDNALVQLAVRADNWLHVQARREDGLLDTPIGFAIKRDLRAAFDPQDDDWRRTVWARSIETLEKAVKGLPRL
jgi:hypothetical protein